jgi:alpha-ketoglutarate-dependent taurine dioxygenase
MAIPVESSRLLEPTGSALGAVVRGVDASAPLPAATILALKQGLLDHQILIFQGQDLSRRAASPPTSCSSRMSMAATRATKS